MATIQKRNSSYRITVSCGYDVNGRQIRRSKTWNPAPGMTNKQIEKELERQAFLFEEKVKSGYYVDDNIKFIDFAERWFNDHAKKQLKERTIHRYRSLLSRTNEAIGHIKLNNLKPIHLLTFYNNLSEDGMNLKTGGKLSTKTIRHYHSLISSILSKAVEWQVIEQNPAERVAPPKVERKEATYLDDEEAARLIELIQKEDIQRQTMITLLLYSGMRRGELLGLEWKDVDFDNKLLHIVRTSLYLPGKGIFEDTPKNESSKRVVKLSDEMIVILKVFRSWQSQERLRLGDQWENHSKLFTQWNGKPMHPDTLTNWFSRFAKRKDLPSITTKSLRHTNATLLIANKVPLKTVSARLGHAQMSTTSNIYAHAIRSADEAAAEALGDILSLKNKKITG